MPRFIYISIDGVLSHLGFSQVFRVLEGLAQRGLPSTLVTLESARDLVDKERVDGLSERAQKAGIDWTWRPYADGGSARNAVRNLAALTSLATVAAVRERPTHFHARGYQAASVTLGLQAAFRRPWIFDARGFWIDERLEEGRWFTNPTALKAARRLERSLYQSADEVVTLTALHASDLVDLGLRPAAKPAVVIPTCADFQDFRPQQEADLQRLPPEVRTKLLGRPVYGIIGSLNRAYLPRETARLAALCLEHDPRAHLLVLTKQGGSWKQALEGAGVDGTRTTLMAVPHEEMPRWMSLITWCLMLLAPETKATRAAMPTKLAELFASNVRGAFHGCNTEAADWIQQMEAGLILERVDEESLVAAARAMTSGTLVPPSSRNSARAHFSLSSGLDRYERLIRRLSDTRPPADPQGLPPPYNTHSPRDAGRSSH